MTRVVLFLCGMTEDHVQQENTMAGFLLSGVTFLYLSSLITFYIVSLFN